MPLVSNQSIQLLSYTTALPATGSTEIVYYFNSKYWMYIGGVYVEVFTPGSAGTNGNTILNGVLPPASFIGVAGDFYIDTVTNTIYGPKVGNVWGAGTSIKGANGANGATGPAGSTGAAGSAGPTGSVGPIGPTGIQGPPGISPGGLTWKGNYNAGTTYITNDTALYNGASYWVYNGPVTGVIPTNNGAQWALLSAGGATGAQGPIGPTGAQGPTGSTGPAGTNGTNGLPGATGATGATGAQGPAGAVGPTGATGTNGANGTNGTNGKTVLNGTGVPANSLGADADFYLDTNTYIIYGPKAAGVWPTPGAQLSNPWKMPRVTTAERTALGLTLTFLDAGYQVYDINKNCVYIWEFGIASPIFGDPDTYAWFAVSTNEIEIITTNSVLTTLQRNKIIYVDSSSDIILYCKTSNLSALASMLRIGDSLTVVRRGTGEVTITTANLSFGPQLFVLSTNNEKRLRAQYSFCTVTRYDANNFMIAGDLKV
jgi:hypothetical protein